jgi:3-methyladenine DNA glycosylase AlkD
MLFTSEVKMGKKNIYSLVNPVLDAQIKEIRRKIRLSMNGIVSGQMTRSGILYKQNYGVSIPRIKEIAAGFLPDHDLAQRLWFLQIRETMIMATLLEPLSEFTAETAREWVSQFNQIEIIEQATMNLFSKLSISDVLCLEWIKSEYSWTQITGFILTSRIVEKLNQNQIDVIIQRAFKLSATDDLHLYKAVALCLSRLCRKDNETATSILKGIESFSQTTSAGQSYISTEVKQEILFLNNL